VKKECMPCRGENRHKKGNKRRGPIKIKMWVVVGGEPQHHPYDKNPPTKCIISVFILLGYLVILVL